MSKNNKKIPYIRIGCHYKKIVEKPRVAGKTFIKLVDWHRTALIDDYGKNILKEIPKYHDTIVYPSHFNYRREIFGFYNIYEPLPYIPEEGNCETIINFLKHIFKEQYEIGLDYFKILVEEPNQLLPIICLVSQERKTGKTTFLHFLKEIFGQNVTINSSKNMKSIFNFDFVGKLIIGIEEVLFDKLEETEKIKQLVTARSFKSEAKSINRVEEYFFSKFILLSNHVDTFIKIEKGEDRFWVIEVKPFEIEDVHLMAKMINEIPAFLWYLTTRNFYTNNETRLWFKFEHYHTKALDKLIKNLKDLKNVEHELIAIFITILDEFEITELKFQPNDLINLLSKSSTKASHIDIRFIVKKKWCLKPTSNTLTYKKFSILNDGTFDFKPATGRYYTINKEWIAQNFDELMN